MSTHTLCFRAKNKENMYTLVNGVYYIKVGCRRVTFTRACYPDVGIILSEII